MTEKRQPERAEPEIEPRQILRAVRELVEELEPGDGRAKEVRLDSALGSDLGIDSLGRAELLRRLEDRFGVALPERVITDAESPRDLLRAVRSAAPRRRRREEELVREEVVPHEEGDEEETEPTEAATLLEVLAWHAERHPDRRHVLFLEPGPGEGDESELTYGRLRERSEAVAAALQEMDLEPGESVALMLPSGLDYFSTFLAVQRAGGVPVPLYPPTRRSQIEDHLRRQAGILDNARARILVTFEDVKRLARLVKAKVPSLGPVVTSKELDGDSGSLREVRPQGDDVAFLQYTSGSTGAPKGVILTHANLLANLRSMKQVIRIEDDDVIVSWLPLYHDMGLIGAWMGSLYFGIPLVLMSPLSFLSRPTRWLRAIHRYRGTLSAAPNFAYELCLKKLDEEELEGLDLSSWRIALNGAEPVSPRSVERFPERFGGLGFRPRTMMPVYGLAECSLAVTFSDPGEEPKIDSVDRETFQEKRHAKPAAEGAENPQRFVSCGRPIPGHEVRFVDSQEREVGEREEGRLQFRGPSATSGYFRNPKGTARLMRADGWLDSEDLGYQAEGEIYLTGRSKDVIIRAGRNIYPEELEDAVGDLEGVRRGCAAVFAVEDEGPERLVVLAETRLDEEDEAAREELRENIEGVTLDLTGTAPDAVVLVPPRTVPKTSSGKLRRSAAKELYAEGKLEAPTRAVWLQVLRLALSGARPALRRLQRRIAGLAYAGWFWGLTGLVAIPVWPLVCLLPVRAWRRRLVRRAARVMAGLTGTRLEVHGLEMLDEEKGPRVVTANHASYLDGFVLAAVLPPRAAYVVKRELAENPFARLFLDRLGCIFVERFDPARGEEASRKTLRRLQRGDHVVTFPEGTFQRAPGLLPLRMGAFVVAARAGAPLVPLVIRGTRSKLRAESWFPRPGSVRVEACPEIEPEGEEWEDAVVLRRRARSEMLDRLGEPDLSPASPTTSPPAGGG